MKKLIDFIKKNWSIVAIVCLIIGFMIYASSREKQIANDAAEKARLRQQVANEYAKRTQIQLENIVLEAERDKLKEQRDSVKAAQDKQQAYYEAEIRRHKAEIDSLMNIPNDTIFVRLQPIFPNFDQGPLLYPFSGSQIRQIYHTAISYPRLQKENDLQKDLLATCINLNNEYEKSEENFNAIIDNLNKNIESCDKQLSLKDDELKITERQLSRKNFWNWTQKGIIAAAVTFIILK